MELILCKNRSKFIYIYNTFTDRIVALSVEADELIAQYKENILALENVHPDLFGHLVEGKYIVQKDLEEWKEVVSLWERDDNSLDKFTMIINPTLNCNMQCKYCYEQHDVTSYMSEEIVQAIKKLIQKKVNVAELKGLNIDFFGGEPLLHYNKSIRPILDFAYGECIRQDKQLFVSFTTNGYLLSEKIIEELNKYAKWGKIRMQITLDGNESLHNHTKSLEGKHPTFRKIISNICNCVQHKINVMVRFNYTHENINSFYDVIDEFKTLPEDEKRNLSFSMHKVWQEPNSPGLDKDVTALKETFSSEGFIVDFAEPLSKERCYGDRENFIVINYNGDLYKCTARDFTPSNKEGLLTSDGELVWNDRYKLRIALKKCYPVCHRCMLFPICHAGCTQNKLETLLQDKECLYKYTENQKTKLLETKIEHRLKYSSL